jgi:hypothetical protein
MPSLLRLLPVCALLVTAAALPVAGSATAGATGPCTLDIRGGAGDAKTLGATASSPALDVVRATISVTRETVTSTITVASLDGVPSGPLGQYFETYFFSSAQSAPAVVTFGSWRSDRSGGGPSLYSSKRPILTSAYGEPTVDHSAVPTSLTTRYDVKRSRIVTTISRADLQAALGGSLRGFAPTLVGVRSLTVDPIPSYRPRMVDDGAHTSAPFSFAACDRWLARTRAPSRPAPNPCTLDIGAETGDEEGPIPSAGQGDVRDDSLDVTSVRYRITKADLVVQLSLARLSPAPVLGTGQGYFAFFRVLDRVGTIGAYRDSRAGTHPAGTFALTPPVATAFDASHDLVTLTVNRADLARTLGLKSTTRLVLTLPGARTDARINGAGLYTADKAAMSPKAALSFSSCDRELARQR